MNANVKPEANSDAIAQTPATAPEKTAAATPETTSGGPVYRPLADIFETDQGVTMLLDMPGVGPDDVEITLENRVLTIRGTVAPTRPEKLQPVHAEYGEGNFERAFTLSEDFDPDRIEASMRAGVLTLQLPRAPEARPKKIAVKSA